ncbi:Zinc finger CCCH domain-containing protein 3 [Morella rubra]|uniref:Zinc finger CCCH domain-containing protein 3 n=1 Tax=Morella rubra TaxID=262757 RepID=A0A6A1UQL9_9ROSI|nr:Zinc finger CCCH domain-containing protein 3 [Morella rubra]
MPLGKYYCDCDKVSRHAVCSEAPSPSLHHLRAKARFPQSPRSDPGLYRGNCERGLQPFFQYGDLVGDRMGMSLGNLPPSLKPPPEGGYPPLPFVDWG